MFLLNCIPVFLFVAQKESKFLRSSNTQFGTTKSYEVCLSPGCVADGAQATLDKLQALSPPSFCIDSGVCCSLCGNGPIVIDIESNKKHRRVSSTKLLDLLLLDDQDVLSTQQKVVSEAYDMVANAHDCLDRKDYEKAVSLYEEGISLSFEMAMEMQRAREAYEGDTKQHEKDSVPPGLQWLVKGRNGEAKAKMIMGDLEGAVSAALEACSLARNASPDTFELLQEIYNKKGDLNGELSALQSFFALPTPDRTTTMVENKRRELGFRLASLERRLVQE